MEEKMDKEGKTVLSYFKRSGVCKNINDVLTAIRILSTEQKKLTYIFYDRIPVQYGNDDIWRSGYLF